MTGTEQFYLYSTVKQQLFGTCCTLFYFYLKYDPKPTEAIKKEKGLLKIPNAF